VRAKHPEYSVGDVAKELGKRWEAVTDRTKYEKQAAIEKAKYEKVNLVAMIHNIIMYFYHRSY